MGLSPHGSKIAATAPGFTFSNANKGWKQCISQFVKKEFFLCLSSFINEKKSFPEVPTKLGHRVSPKCEGCWDSEYPSCSGGGWKRVGMAGM